MLLECQNVTKKFGGITALEDVSFSVEESQRVGLVGPNGAGKTTLFNTITGVVNPDEGQIRFRGEDVTAWPPYQITRAGIARTFQTPKPFDSLTVEENVRVGARFGRGPDDDREDASEVDEVLSLFGMTDESETSAKNLQLLEQKYLALARVLATAPTLVLLDEIMAGLNPGEKDDMVGKLKDIQAEYSLSLLVIEHNLGVIRSLSDKLYVIDKGRNLASGTPEEVLNSEIVQDAYIRSEAV